jgi:hypothetical protein
MPDLKPDNGYASSAVAMHPFSCRLPNCTNLSVLSSEFELMSSDVMNVKPVQEDSMCQSILHSSLAWHCVKMRMHHMHKHLNMPLAVTGYAGQTRIIACRGSKS